MGNLYFSVGRDAPHPSYLEIEMFILFGTVNGGRELYDSLMYMSAPEVEKQILPYSRVTFCRKEAGSQRIQVWYIHLHLVDFYGKCR